jgi:hypothetical protein
MRWEQLPINTTFDRARRREVYHRLARVVRREAPADSVVLDDLRAHVRLFEQSYVGIMPIPVAQIVGTSSRSDDFDESFLPRRPETRDRWLRLERAFPDSAFPPIIAYRVGNAYFVVDGRHRVAIARQRGVEYVDAEVTDLRARFEIPPGADIGAMILNEQKALFLEETGLQRYEREGSLEFTHAQGYAELLEVIKVHAYELSVREQRFVAFKEAARDFYENVFRPTIDAIESADLGNAFPECSKADLFLWVCERRRSLFPECGAMDLADIVRKEATAPGTHGRAPSRLKIQGNS